MTTHRHLNAESLRRLLDGPRGGSLASLREALACPRCQWFLSLLLQPRPPEQEEAPEGGAPFSAPGPDYAEVIERSRWTLRERLAAAGREAAEAPGLLAELLRHPPLRRELLVRNQERFRSLALCRAVIEQGRVELFNEPRRSRELGRLALALTEGLSPEHHGTAQIHDARAGAWRCVALADSGLGELEAARRGLDSAQRHLELGSGDPLQNGLFLREKASVQIKRFELVPAAWHLERAKVTFHQLDEPQLQAQAVVARAIIASDAGLYSEAVARLWQAKLLLKNNPDPRTDLFIRNNLVIELVYLRRIEEAERLFARSQHAYDQISDRSLQLRRSWVAGRISTGLHRYSQAEMAFREVRRGFLELGGQLNAALASLDLAGVLIAQGRTAEVKRLAEELLPTLRARDWQREVRRAEVLLKEARGLERLIRRRRAGPGAGETPPARHPGPEERKRGGRVLPFYRS